MKTASEIKQALLNGEEVSVNKWAILINDDDQVEIWNPNGSGVSASMFHLDRAINDFVKAAGIPEKMPKPKGYPAPKKPSTVMGPDSTTNKPWKDPKVQQQPEVQGDTSDPELGEDSSKKKPWKDPAVNKLPQEPHGRGGLPDKELGKDTTKNKTKWAGYDGTPNEKSDPYEVEGDQEAHKIKNKGETPSSLDEFKASKEKIAGDIEYDFGELDRSQVPQTVQEYESNQNKLKGISEDTEESDFSVGDRVVVIEDGGEDFVGLAGVVTNLYPKDYKVRVLFDFGDSYRVPEEFLAKEELLSKESSKRTNQIVDSFEGFEDRGASYKQLVAASPSANLLRDIADPEKWALNQVLAQADKSDFRGGRGLEDPSDKSANEEEEVENKNASNKVAGPKLQESWGDAGYKRDLEAESAEELYHLTRAFGTEDEYDWASKYKPNMPGSDQNSVQDPNAPQATVDQSGAVVANRLAQEVAPWPTGEEQDQQQEAWVINVRGLENQIFGSYDEAYAVYLQYINLNPADADERIQQIASKLASSVIVKVADGDKGETLREFYNRAKGLTNTFDKIINPKTQQPVQDPAEVIEKVSVDEKAKSYWKDYYKDYGVEMSKDDSGNKDRKDTKKSDGFEPKVDESPDHDDQGSDVEEFKAKSAQNMPPGGQIAPEETKAPSTPTPAPAAPMGQQKPPAPRPGAGDEGLKALGWNDEEIKTMDPDSKQKILQIQLKKPGTGIPAPNPAAPKPPVPGANPAAPPGAPPAGPAAPKPSPAAPVPQSGAAPMPMAVGAKVKAAFDRLVGQTVTEKEEFNFDDIDDEPEANAFQIYNYAPETSDNFNRLAPKDKILTTRTSQTVPVPQQLPAEPAGQPSSQAPAAPKVNAPGKPGQDAAAAGKPEPMPPTGKEEPQFSAMDDNSPEANAMQIYNDVLQQNVQAATPEQVPAIKAQLLVQRLLTEVGMPVNEARTLFGIPKDKGFNTLFR